MKTETISTKDPAAISQAINTLENGGLVAFPTDTVYGLAAPAFSEESIERLYVVKGRNHTKAIALLLGSSQQLDQISVNLSPEARKLAQMFWPGPLTIIVPRHPNLPEVLAPTPTIGVRVPDHPAALTLMAQTGPLAVTSANLSGDKNASTAKEVFRQLKGRVHLILDGGQTPGGVPSTVVDCTTPELKVLRPGPLSLKNLTSVIS
jgi:L-threonylcarbamoyladenylate synthase